MMWVLLWVSLTGVSSVQQGTGCTLSGAERFDCFPRNTVDKDSCIARGCCWAPTTDDNVPFCYYPIGFGYTLGSLVNTSNGWDATLTTGPPTRKGAYGPDVSPLKVRFTMETDTRAHIKITDPHAAREEVPIPTPSSTTRASSPQYTVHYTSHPFTVSLVQKSSQATVFNTNVGALVFEDQFLQLSTTLPTRYAYGLGEHVAPWLLPLDGWGTTPLLARDQGTPEGMQHNLYASHPMYMGYTETGDAFGVFLLNSHPMEVALQPLPALTFRAIGGVLDVYVFFGPTPVEVVQQYLAVVGLPYFPPYWGLGFHLCRWGYGSSNRTLEIVQRMRAAGIPQDTQWNDIDYMSNHLDFTYDKNKYHGLPDLVDDLHQHGQHYIMITDPGISSTQPHGSYPAYERGLALDAFIKHEDGSVLIGKVWPGETAFPDFFAPKAVQYWTEMVQTFHGEVPFDGLWIDMNEPSNFVEGSTVGCPSNNKWDNPPYFPHIDGTALKVKTLCMSSLQGPNKTHHYALHNMYGWSEMVATDAALTTTLKRRTMVISRSTFPSSGRYGGHWLGDNTATWDDLYYSIPGVLNFQLFGIPLVGADICGFGGTTTPELCTRWMQLGSFYPFSRNHNAIGQPDQDPTSLGAGVEAASRKALRIRYTLLPYLYTLFFLAHTTGTPVARPLSFLVPKDKATYAIDRQFMWGDALLITPVLEKGATSVSGYFPSGSWYDLYQQQVVNSTGQKVTLSAPLDHIPLHIRGGSILPTQEPNLTTTLSRKNPFIIIVALDTEGSASGELFWDDGDALDSISGQKYTHIKYNAGRNSVDGVQVVSGLKGASVGSVQVWGVGYTVKNVTVNGQSAHFTQEGHRLNVVMHVALEEALHVRYS